MIDICCNGDVAGGGGGGGGGDTAVFDTFTPWFADASLVEGEGVYTTQDGSYVKIGNLVHVSIHLELSAFGTLTTSEPAHILTLPFPAHASHRGGLFVAYAASLTIGGGEYLTASIAANTSHATLRLWNSTTGPTTGLISNVGIDGRVEIHGTYIAA